MLGVAGDTVAKRGDTFYRNGVVVPTNEAPIRGEVLPDFELVVPPDSVFAPVTGIPREMLSGLTGGGHVDYVGQPGYGIPKWPQLGVIPIDAVRSRAVVILDPPRNRRWID